MGRIVIETDDETGVTTVDLTMSNGQRVKMTGTSDSELRYVQPEPERVDIGTMGRVEYVNGRTEDPYWRFSLTVDHIPRLEEIT